MLLIIFWQVLVFLIAFLSLKQAKNEGKLSIIHGKARLKLNYMKNPSFGELQSLCQINQVCKEENQRKNLTLKNFELLTKFSQDRRKFHSQLSPLAKFLQLLFHLRKFCISFTALRKFCISFSLAKFSQLHI